MGTQKEQDYENNSTGLITHLHMYKVKEDRCVLLLLGARASSTRDKSGDETGGMCIAVQ